MTLLRLGVAMVGDDSVGFGSPNILGGFRKPAEAVLIRYPFFSFTGPYNFSASPGMTYEQHYALPGQTAEQALVAAGGIIGNVGTYQPDVLTIGWGINDLSAGKTPAQVRDLRAQIIADARTAKPNIKIIQRSIVCQGCAQNVGGNVTALNTLLQTLATSTGTIWWDAGTPPTGDTIHPTEAGYATMGVQLAQVIIEAFTPYARFEAPAMKRTFAAGAMQRTFAAPSMQRVFAPR